MFSVAKIKRSYYVIICTDQTSLSVRTIPYTVCVATASIANTPWFPCSTHSIIVGAANDMEACPSAMKTLKCGI